MRAVKGLAAHRFRLLDSGTLVLALAKVREGSAEAERISALTAEEAEEAAMAEAEEAVTAATLLSLKRAAGAEALL